MHVPPRLLQRVLHGQRRDGVQPRVPFRAHPVGHDLGQRRQSQLLGPLALHHDDGRSPVRDLRSVAGGDGPIRPECRLQLRQRLGGRVRPDAFIRRDHHRVSLPLRDLEGDHFLREPAGGPGLVGPLVRPGGPRILVLARDADLRVHLVGGIAHVCVGEGRPQTVVDHRVDDLGVAHPNTPSRAGDDVGSLRHGLHASGHHHLDFTRPDQLIGQRDGVQPGKADLVDGDGGNLLGDASIDRGLTSGYLPRSGLEDLPHDHVVHPIGRDPRPGQCLPDRVAPELDRRDVLESGAELADGRPRSGHDHG